MKRRERQELLEQMLKDMIDAVNVLYGPDGLGRVVDQMKRCNRVREDSAEIDALEKMFADMRR